MYKEKEMILLLPLLNNILKTQSELLAPGYTVENNIIKCVDMVCIGHFGNAVCFQIVCKNVTPLPLSNSVGNVGWVFKAFIELFDLSKEDGVALSEIRNIPCRIIFDSSGVARAIGHFMEDKFVLISDLVKIGSEAS